MTVSKKQIMPALHNSEKVKDPDLSEVGDRNYTATILKYANLALPFPQLETDAKTIVAAINESQVVANPEIPAEPESLSSIQIKDTVYTISGGGGGTTVIPNPTGTPTDTLNTVKIDNTIYDVGSSGPATTLAELQDTDINSPANREYLTYDAGDKKWKNTDINSLLTATTRGQYCNFYTPLSAGLLNCRVYAGLRVEPGTPTPNSSRFPIRYSTLAVGSCSNSGSYSYYLSGLFSTLGFEGCTWYLDLGSLSWYYEDGVFKAQGYYFNEPKENFSCICSNNEYTYSGSSTSVDKTIGYWSPSSNTYAFWIRDDQFNGDVSAFTSHVSGIYTLYESRDNNNSISINSYNMLLSKFNLDSWAVKLSWADLSQDFYAGEWDLLNKIIYYTWAIKSNTDMLTGYTVTGNYVIYSTDDWELTLKSGGSAFCTNFAFESATETPSVNCFSIYNNKVIFNIASLQSSWSDWLQFNTTFKFHYETSDVTTSSLYYDNIPATYKTMNFMWSNTDDGSIEAQYYSGDAIPYIDFTNAVIGNAELNDLNNVSISGVQDGEVLKYNSTSGKWENNTDLNTPDYEDLSNKPMINGHVLIGNQSGEDLDLGGGGGGGGDITIKTFQSDNQYVSASHAKYFEIGKIVFVDCVFSISGSITTNTSIFSGLPAAAYLSYLLGASNNSSLNRFYVENNNIYAAMTFSSNARTYHIYGSYLKS